MTSLVRLALASVLLLALAGCGSDGGEADTAATRAQAGQDGVRVRTVARGLEIPWEIAFLPDRRALVTERPGRIRLLERDGTLRRAPIARVPVQALGEGGLLGLALDPEFASNRFLYLYFTTNGGMQLERWRMDERDRLRRERSLVEGIAAGPIHDSGRIAFGPDGRLYVATGDAGEGRLAQQRSSLNGKFLALAPEQYRGAGGRPEIVSTGHRNPQGFDWQPGTGRLYATEHGPSGGDGPQGYDEVNRIAGGRNYGWPEVYGAGHGSFAAPLRVYREAIAPGGATFLERPGSRWTGDYVFAALRGEQLRRLEIRGGRVRADRPLLSGRFGRLRTVVEGPGGALYVLTSNRDGRGSPRSGDDKILRVSPPR